MRPGYDAGKAFVANWRKYPHIQNHNVAEKIKINDLQSEIVSFQSRYDSSEENNNTIGDFLFSDA